MDFLLVEVERVLTNDNRGREQRRLTLSVNTSFILTKKAKNLKSSECIVICSLFSDLKFKNRWVPHELYMHHQQRHGNDYQLRGIWEVFLSKSIKNRFVCIHLINTLLAFYSFCKLLYHLMWGLCLKSLFICEEYLNNWYGSSLSCAINSLLSVLKSTFSIR